MATPGKRWDTDTRGTGIADAAAGLPALDLLADAMRTAGWVAEEPELHLLPHLEAGAETVGATIRRTSAADGAFEVELERDERSGPEMRMVTMALVSTVAEA